MAASGFKAAMAEKSRVKDAAEMAGTLALVLGLGPDVDELLLHAAAIRPATATPEVMTNFLATCFNETTLFVRISLRPSARPPVGRPGGDRSFRAL
jgi:hypothetical protein